MGDQVTGADTLTVAGRTIFGTKFVGVHARDKFPFPSLKPGDMGIINNQASNQGGEHWIGIARGVQEPSRVFVYDSFGRDNIIKPRQVKQLPKGAQLEHTSTTAEQEDNEDNCGQRCLAWLMIYQQCGERIANLI